MKILITVQGLKVEAKLNDTKTAARIYDILPIESSFQTWGDEIYFSIPLRMEPENSKEVVEVGDLGYWPQGNCFCIFYGKTPMSTNDNPVPASAVNVFGKIVGDPGLLRDIKGNKIRVEKRK